MKVEVFQVWGPKFLEELSLLQMSKIQAGMFIKADQTQDGLFLENPACQNLVV
jgi:hypothetical protein